MIILYHGFVVKALDPSLMALAEIIWEPGDDAPAAHASAGSQMSLMALPEHVLKRPRVRGHAAMPGSGPAGQTCGTCGSLSRRGTGAKTYIKCGLTQSKWTGGAGSNVRVKDPACVKWSKDFRQS